MSCPRYVNMTDFEESILKRRDGISMELFMELCILQKRDISSPPPVQWLVPQKNN